ncbi:MAG: GNAT family N-acetyltransferase [Oligoflexia bacterium]|nr:GNAT family N-acetyltransferase [Oligoflexia bacterium]
MEIKIDESLKLRFFTNEDAKELFELTDRNREHLKEWLPWLDRNTKEEDSLGFIKMVTSQREKNNGLQFAICYEGQIAGVVGHHKIDWGNKNTPLGYWLGNDFGGKGIMTRACQALIDYSFNDLNLHLVSICAAVENKKSRAVIERLGLKLDGILREREWLYDHFVDHAEYSITKDEWKKLHHN